MDCETGKWQTHYHGCDCLEIKDTEIANLKEALRVIKEKAEMAECPSGCDSCYEFKRLIIQIAAILEGK